MALKFMKPKNSKRVTNDDLGLHLFFSSELSDRHCVDLFFFACQRGWWRAMGTPTLCLENWLPKIWGLEK